MLTPSATRRFRKDRKRVAKRDKDLSKLETVMDKLVREEELDPTYHVHPLRGEWKGHMECHIESDWLLIWFTTETEIVFVRTGTHADLFE